LDRARERPLADQFVGRRYLQPLLVLGALAIGPLTIDTYLAGAAFIVGGPAGY